MDNKDKLYPKGRRRASANRQLKNVPGLRNISLLLGLVLVPAFSFLAWLDSMGNHVAYSWLFLAAFWGMFAYGLLSILDPGLRRGAAYIAVGFISIPVVSNLIGEELGGGQVFWGMLLGWFSGASAVSCAMWLKLRKEWNAEHPYARC